MIGDNIELIIFSIEGDTIKVGIEAPRQVEIYRKELYLAIQQSNLEAAMSSLSPMKLSDLFKGDIKGRDPSENSEK